MSPSTSLDAIRSQLKESHAGDPWYGSSRTRLLRGVSAERAAAHPIPGVHSIWQLVLHLTAWTAEVQQRLEGSAPGEPAEGDWPVVPEPTAEAWRSAVDGLARTHASLMEAVDRIGEGDVGRDVGNGVDVATMLVGLAQHDAYHAGQLAVLRRALDTVLA